MNGTAHLSRLVVQKASERLLGGAIGLFSPEDEAGLFDWFTKGRGARGKVAKAAMPMLRGLLSKEITMDSDSDGEDQDSTAPSQDDPENTSPGSSPFFLEEVY